MTQVVHEITEIFELQKKEQWKFKNTSAHERIVLLEKLGANLEKNRSEVDKALYADLGRPIGGQLSEVDMILEDIKHTVVHLEEWMTPEVKQHPTMETASYYIQYEPRGVCLLLAPWNFPVSMVFTPLVALLSAGNTVIVKASRQTPNASKIISKIIRETFDELVVAVYEGDNEVVTSLPFDHIFLTGSPRVGKLVMGEAAKHLASVTLELGGRNPLIVDETADLKTVALNVCIAKSVNSGQICLSVNHVFVPRALQQKLVDEIKTGLLNMLYVEGTYQHERVGRIVNRSNFGRLAGYLQDATERGATIQFGGKTDVDALVIEPTIITEVPKESDLIQNEIFGPLIPIIPYDDIAEVVEHVNEGGKPLGMYIFSNDQSFINHLLQNTSAGGVTINGWALHGSEHDLPFGGVKESGIGYYHGKHGFVGLSHSKAVFRTL